MQARKKRKLEESKAPSAPPEPEVQESRPMTFEELLKEIEAAKNPIPPKRPAYQPEPVVDYDDDLEEEAKPQMRETYTYKASQEKNETYEKARQDAFNRPSLEETMKLQDTVVRFNPFEGYQQEIRVTPATEIAAQIKNPTSLRKAILLSEILKRKF